MRYDLENGRSQTVTRIQCKTEKIETEQVSVSYKYIFYQTHLENTLLAIIIQCPITNMIPIPINRLL